jgi:hypothetical protein
MNDSEPRRTVNEALRLDPLGLNCVGISRLDRFAKATDRGTESCSAHTVAGTTANILTHSLLRRFDYWHLRENSFDG